MQGPGTSPPTDKTQALLWAILEFRKGLETMIEDQKTLILDQFSNHETPAAEPLAAVSIPAPVAAPIMAPEPIAPIRKVARFEPRYHATDPISPPVSSPSPVPIPAHPDREIHDGSSGSEPARPEDARQRLDALAAKLLDRRLKQTATPAPENGR